MRDTSPEIEEKVHEMIRAKTPAERYEMGRSMYLTSRYLVIQAILRENPAISEGDLRKELFLRFYLEDFTKEEQEKIIAYLQRAKPTP